MTFFTSLPHYRSSYFLYTAMSTFMSFFPGSLLTSKCSHTARPFLEMMAWWKARQI